MFPEQLLWNLITFLENLIILIGAPFLFFPSPLNSLTNGGHCGQGS